MTTDKIIKYIMNTSNNPNPAVLQDILGSIENTNSNQDTEILEDFLSKTFIVTFSYDPYNYGGLYIGNKLSTNICDAFDEGKNVIGLLELNDSPYEWGIMYEYSWDNNGNPWIQFVLINGESTFSTNSQTSEGYPIIP